MFTNNQKTIKLHYINNNLDKRQPDTWLYVCFNLMPIILIICTFVYCYICRTVYLVHSVSTFTSLNLITFIFNIWPRLWLSVDNLLYELVFTLQFNNCDISREKAESRNPRWREIWFNRNRKRIVHDFFQRPKSEPRTKKKFVRGAIFIFLALSIKLENKIETLMVYLIQISNKLMWNSDMLVKNLYVNIDLIR